MTTRVETDHPEVELDARARGHVEASRDAPLLVHLGERAHPDLGEE